MSRIVTTGMDMRSRRSLAWSPAKLGGTVLWVRADAGVIQSAGAVSQWQDQSASANHANSISGTKPVYSATAAPHGLPSVNFAGMGSGLFGSAAAVVAAGSDRTVFAAARPAAAVGGTVLACAIAAPFAGFFHFQAGPNFIYTDGISTNNTVTSAPTNASHIYQWGYHLGSQMTFALDGATQVISGGNATSDSGTAGYYLGTNASLQLFQGEIFEIVVANRIVSGGEAALMHTYMSRWQ